MICDICNSNDTYIKMHEHEYSIKGKTITFALERRFCKSCNNLVYDEVLDNNASIKAISMYNELYGIDKDKIIKLRKSYNLSIELFSKVIGCAKKTLISYEKGMSIPNDSYLIIIKSLINNPSSIKNIIEANKEQFTEKEYIRIKEKITLSIPNINDDTKGLNYTPSEYNGYSKLSKEKIYNVILYFAKSGVLKTKLLKELFYADFLYYKNNCASITGLEYVKLTFGPVPDKFEIILNDCLKNNFIDYQIKYNNQYESHNIKAINEFDSSLFTEDELNILKIVETKFRNYKSKDIVDYSHKEKAFIDSKYYEKISYDYAFYLES